MILFRPWQGLEQLTSLIFAKALPKQLGRQQLTGSVLAALTGAYVDAINGGAVPTITTAWQVGLDAKALSIQMPAIQQTMREMRTACRVDQDCNEISGFHDEVAIAGAWS